LYRNILKKTTAMLTKKIIILVVLFCQLTILYAQQKENLITVKTPVFKKDTFNIVKYNAIGNGLYLNSKAINAAIDACSKKGGGVVLIPNGLWLTGPIVLKNNVNLHIAKGATLLFTNDKTQYKLVASNWEGLDQMRNESPISATNASNIAITGSGIIDGNGDAWRAVKKDKLSESQWKKLVASGGIVGSDNKNWYPSQSYMNGNALKNAGEITVEKTDSFYRSVKDFLRPNLLVLTNCKNILLDGNIYQNSAAWCLHPLMSENLIVKNVTVKNPWYAQNGDGIDVESCKNVVIENCIFDVGDDALCMKSGRNAAGRKRGMPVENVSIKNCTVYASHGGFVIGSEMSGGAKNIYVSNCTFIGTDIGLRFKTTRGRGGVVENIFIKDIYMKDIVGEAILFDMYYEGKDPIAAVGEKRELPKAEFKTVDETTPVFKNFNISNVYCNGAAKGIFVRGIPEMHVNNVVLENMVLQSNVGIELQEASNIAFKNITVLASEKNPLIDVTQCDHIKFENVTGSETETLRFRFNGERTTANEIKNDAATKAKTITTFELGALLNATSIK
jgi:polygalacturonase